MNIQHEKRRALGHARPCFGGDSSTSSTTNITDQRVVGGDGSVNVSASGKSAVSVVATDHGAVSAGLELGTRAIDATAKSAAATLATGASMFDGAIAAVKASNEQLADAYEKGQAEDQSMLKIAGFVVVGLAAVALLPRLKG